MFLQDLTGIHLHSRLDYEITPNSNHTYILVLSVIAVFLLLIASINFMNLATATAGSRAREIGIRKVTGADRLKLIVQFIGESLVLTLLRFILSMFLIEIILPWFNNFTEKEMRFDYLLNPVSLLYLGRVMAFTGNNVRSLSCIIPVVVQAHFNFEGKPCQRLADRPGQEDPCRLPVYDFYWSDHKYSDDFSTGQLPEAG
jgi:putative ABC transport system permease protein